MELWRVPDKKAVPPLAGLIIPPAYVFLHVFICLVLFGAVWEKELYLISSVQFGQNAKTPLWLVTILRYSKVASSNMSCLKADAGYFILLINGTFYPHLL